MAYRYHLKADTNIRSNDGTFVLYHEFRHMSKTINWDLRDLQERET